jgi:hypothetical protein
MCASGASISKRRGYSGARSPRKAEETLAIHRPAGSAAAANQLCDDEIDRVGLPGTVDHLAQRETESRGEKSAPSYDWRPSLALDIVPRWKLLEPAAESLGAVSICSDCVGICRAVRVRYATLARASAFPPQPCSRRCMASIAVMISCWRIAAIVCRRRVRGNSRSVANALIVARMASQRSANSLRLSSQTIVFTLWKCKLAVQRRRRPFGICQSQGSCRRSPGN